MPRIRVVQKAYVAVLAYFASAPLAEASLVLDLAGQRLKEREAPAMASVPPTATTAPAAEPAKAQTKAPKAKVSTKQPAPKAAAPVQRKKPGPKPGSHRRKKHTPGTGPGEYVPQAVAEPINEEIGDVPIDPSETSLFDEQQVIEPEPEPVGAE